MCVTRKLYSTLRKETYRQRSAQLILLYKSEKNQYFMWNKNLNLPSGVISCTEKANERVS
jgi:uncharacterized protein YbdZ (MbtH family)